MNCIADFALPTTDDSKNLAEQIKLCYNQHMDFLSIL